jgi:hypothetical protein
MMLLPPEFEQWPRERRLHYLEEMMTREHLMRSSLHAAGHDLDRDLSSRTRLRKRELAAILLALQED